MDDGDSSASSVPLRATTAQARRPWLVKLLIGAVVGAIIGAIIGWLVFRTATTESTATAYVRLTQPADLTAVAASAAQTTPDTMDNVRRYVTGEVAFLSGDGFAQVVARKVGESKPVDLVIEHDEESAVVGISDSSDDGDAARRTVQAAIDVYAQDLAQRVDQAMRTIGPAFDQWQQAALASGNVTRAQEIDKLRENVLLQAQSSSMVVLQAPTVDSGAGSDWLMGVLLGAVLGGGAVPLAMNWRRRRSGRVTDVDDLSGVVTTTLVPAVDLRHPRDPQRSPADAALARTLHAQCRSATPTASIAVIGASATSGAQTVTALLEFAATEAVSVAENASTVVVHAGTIGDSQWTPEAIALATEVIVAVEIGVDTVAQVYTARASVPHGTQLRAVLTYRSLARPGRGESVPADGDDARTVGRP